MNSVASLPKGNILWIVCFRSLTCSHIESLSFLMSVFACALAAVRLLLCGAPGRHTLCTLARLPREDESRVFGELADIIVMGSGRVGYAVKVLEELHNPLVKGNLGYLERVCVGHFCKVVDDGDW